MHAWFLSLRVIELLPFTLQFSWTKKVESWEWDALLQTSLYHHPHHYHCSFTNSFHHLIASGQEKVSGKKISPLHSLFLNCKVNLQGVFFFFFSICDLRLEWRFLFWWGVDRSTPWPNSNAMTFVQEVSAQSQANKNGLSDSGGPYRYNSKVGSEFHWRMIKVPLTSCFEKIELATRLLIRWSLANSRFRILLSTFVDYILQFQFIWRNQRTCVWRTSL